MKNMIAMAWCFACVLGVAQGYRIEHSDKPTPVETTAVQELRDYLAKRINGTLSIVFRDNRFIFSSKFANVSGDSGCSGVLLDNCRDCFVTLPDNLLEKSP